MLERNSRDLLLLLALAAVLYLAFPAGILECDAVIYASAGLHRDPIQSTDAGHLIFGSGEFVAGWIGAKMSPPLNPLYIMTWISMLTALSGAWLLYAALRRLGTPQQRSLLVTALLLFSYSYWHFALQGEPHLPSTLFLVAYLSLSWRYLRQPSFLLAAATAAALGAATLLHQTCILMAPAFLVAAATSAARGAQPRSLWLRHSATFLACYFLTAVVPYLAIGAFVRGLHTERGWREWIIGIGYWGIWGNWSVTSLPAALVGFTRSFIGSHYLLGIDGVVRMAHRLFPYASWQDELLLAGQVADWLRHLLLLIQTVLLGATALAMVRLLRRLRALWQRFPAEFTFLITWMLIYGTFATWWAPERAEFWIAMMVPMLALLGMSAETAPPSAATRRGRHLLPAAFVVGLIVVNLLGSIRPQSRAWLEPDTQAMVAVDAVVSSDDVILADTNLYGRATRFIYLVEKIDLSALYDNPTTAIVATVDSVLASVQSRDRELYLIATSLGGDPLRAEAYAEMLRTLREAFVWSEPVPVRAPIELYQILRPAPPATSAASAPRP